jgi:hypothetical protein
MLRFVTNTSKGYTAALVGLGKYEDSSSGRGELKLKVAQTALSSNLAEFSFRGDGQLTVPGNVVLGPNSAPAVKSDTTGVTGADQITNMMSLTQAEYDAIVSPDANTFYVITA